MYVYVCMYFYVCWWNETNKKACRWLLDTLRRKVNIIKEVLLHCPIERTRLVFSDVIIQVLHTLRFQEYTLYMNQYQALKQCTVTGIVSIDSNSVESWIILTIEVLITLMKKARYTWNLEYFSVFQYFIQMGEEERKYLLERDFLFTLRDFIKGINDFDDTIPGTSKHSRTIDDSGKRIDILPAFTCFVYLFRSVSFECNRELWTIDPPTAYHQFPFSLFPSDNFKETYFQLPSKDTAPTSKDTGSSKDTTNKDTTSKVLCEYNYLDDDVFTSLLDKKFIGSVIGECFSRDEAVVVCFITHATWKNKEAVQLFADAIKDKLELTSLVSQAKIYFTSINHLQDVKDSMILDRLTISIEMVLSFVENNLHSQNIVRLAAEWIQIRSKKNQFFKQWISSHQSRVNSVLSKIPPPQRK